MRVLAAIVVLLFGLSLAFGQALIQSGPWTPGHAPGYSGSHGAVPLVQDSGPAGGAGPGLTEGLYIAPPPAGGGAPPFANTGTGPFGTNWCDYDAPVTSNAYHYLCLSPDAAGGGLLAYGAVGSAPQELLSFYINGVKYNFPATLSGILGPVSSTVGDPACWNNATGTLLKDCLALSYDVQRSGFVPGGTDNIPFVTALMTGLIPTAPFGGGFNVNFPFVPGTQYTPYYFSDELQISRGGTWSCSGYSGPRALSGAVLVFAPGVDGVRQESALTSPDGGSATSGTLSNCAIYSLGKGTVNAPGFATGSGSLTVTMSGFGTIPAPGWSNGDGFVAYGGFNGGFVVSSGSISGSVLTVNTLTGLFPITVGSVVLGTNVLPNTFISSFGTGTGGTGTYNLSLVEPATVTATTFTGRNLWWAPIVPAGAYVDTATLSSGSTYNLTIHPGFEPTHTDPASLQGIQDAIWLLPKVQSWTITTTSGSNVFTETSAPTASPNRLLEPGDFIWSQPFLPGCVVNKISGAAGSQSITLTDSAMIVTQATQCNASATGTYTLWKLPSAHRMAIQGQAWNNYYFGFPFGLNQTASSGNIPAINSTAAIVVKNQAESSIVGFMMAGDNVGGSTWIGNEGIHSSFADFVDLSAPGSGPHVGDEMNSPEEQQSPISMETNCFNQNFAPWLGNYFGMPAALPSAVPVSDMIMQATAANSANTCGVELFPIAAGPSDIPAIKPTGLFNFPLFVFGYQNGQPGMYFNTTSSSLYVGGFLSKDGTTGHALGNYYNAPIDAWQINTQNGTTPATSSDLWIGGAYTGYFGPTSNIPYHGFMNGFLLAGPGITVPGGERMFAGGLVAPTDNSATITASQAFTSNSNLLAISSVTGVTALYSIVDTTLGASSIIGTVASSNTTQNWMTLTGVSSITSTGGADSLLINGTTTITASDDFDTTMTMIPVSTCTGVTATMSVTDTTQGGASVGTVSSCGTQATLVGKTAMNHASSGTGDSLTIVQRRQGDEVSNLAPVPGGSGCWRVTDYAGGVRQGCPVSNSATLPDYTAIALRSGASTNKDITGRIALSGGAATYTLTETYASAPNCVAQDVTTPANAASVSESTTVLTFAGTGTDTVKWVCIGRN